jgi:hypothetical protein
LEWNTAFAWGHSTNQAVFEALKEDMADKLSQNSTYATEDGDVDRSWEIIDARIRNMFDHRVRDGKKSKKQKQDDADQASLGQRTIAVSFIYNLKTYTLKIENLPLFFV